METKARYLLVGVCAILALLLFAGFLIFSAQKDARTSLYAIYFKGGVTGLSVGNNVLFNGVPVGQVREIGLSAEDQSKVRVVAAIASDVIVRQDCVATLNAQGITGMTVIYISGGSSASPPLNAGDGDALPIIPAGRSALESLTGGIPEMISTATALMRRMGDAFSEENVENLRLGMASLADLSAALADREGSLHAALDSLRAAGERLNRLLAEADRALAGEVLEAARALRRSFERLDSLLAGLEPGVSRLADGGVNELNGLLGDARALVRRLDRLAREISANPRGFLFGNAVPEYRPQP